MFAGWIDRETKPHKEMRDGYKSTISWNILSILNVFNKMSLSLDGTSAHFRMLMCVICACVICEQIGPVDNATVDSQVTSSTCTSESVFVCR